MTSSFIHSRQLLVLTRSFQFLEGGGLNRETGPHNIQGISKANGGYTRNCATEQAGKGRQIRAVGPFQQLTMNQSVG